MHAVFGTPSDLPAFNLRLTARSYIMCLFEENLQHTPSHPVVRKNGTESQIVIQVLSHKNHASLPILVLKQFLKLTLALLLYVLR